MTGTTSHIIINELPLPSDEKIAALALMLRNHEEKMKKDATYATVKQVLSIVGIGAFIGASFFAPGILMAAKPFLDAKREDDREKWKEFNRYYLRRTIRRLQKEKLVEIREEEGQQIVTLTKNGKRRILKYSIESLAIDKPKRWDGRWRLVLYDVSQKRRVLRDLFRDMLKQLGFYRLQESAWIYPYPCEKHITFLREYYGVGNEVIYVIATTLEDDTPYRTYFKLS